MPSKKDLLSGGAARLFSKPTTQTPDEQKDDKPVKEKRSTREERIKQDVRDNMKPSAGRTGRPLKDAAEGNWSGHRNYYTSIVFDKDQYLRLREIAWENRCSIKETMFQLLQKGISKYEKDGKLQK